MRRFGVELEFASPQKFEEVNSALRRERLSLVNRNGVAKSDGKDWELKLDQTVGGPSIKRDGFCYGYEIASRILEGEPGLRELGHYLQTLNKVRRQQDWEITRKCGLHVHLDLNDLSVGQLRAFIRLILENEPVLLSLQPRSRTGNGYCSSIREVAEYRRLAGLEGTLDDAEFIEQMRDITFRNEHSKDQNEWRYYGLNLVHWLSRGVEIRYGAGSFNPQKVLTWVVLLLMLVDQAKINAEQPQALNLVSI